MLQRYSAALEDFKQYKATDDSIFNTAKSKQIEELRTIYETEKKEKEIALQKSEIQLLEEKDKVNVLQRTLLSGGLLLSLIVVVLLYYGMRQKIKRNRAEKEKVDNELAFKKKELTTHALHLANKNEILEDLKLQIDDLKRNGDQSHEYNRIINTITFNLQDDKNWENFSRHFEQVHKDFNSQIKQKYPEVTSNELRLMALLKMNLSSKEIANMLNISTEGIKKARYRLRKKLNINTDDSLQDLIISL
jgi:DNA-binding CsgD family transcriptional regulator